MRSLPRGHPCPNSRVGAHGCQGSGLNPGLFRALGRSGPVAFFHHPAVGAARARGSEPCTSFFLQAKRPCSVTLP